MLVATPKPQSLFTSSSTEAAPATPVNIAAVKSNDLRARAELIFREYREIDQRPKPSAVQSRPKSNVIPFGRLKGRLADEELITDLEVLVEYPEESLGEDTEEFFLESLQSASYTVIAEVPDFIDDELV
jgi:hypothetical protein